MGSSQSQTLGFAYNMSLHLGLGRGGCDEFKEIRVGDRTAWQGVQAGSGNVWIDKPDLFGGDTAEGGIVGVVHFLNGEDTQVASTIQGKELVGIEYDGGTPVLVYEDFDIMPDVHGALVPEFRRVCTIVFDGLLSKLNPYFKRWSVRRSRALNGWQNDDCWYPAAVKIPMEAGAIGAMNPAHILVQTSTDSDWGRGLPSTRLDLTSYAAAADQLKLEGFGLCLKWSRQDSIDTFEQVVLDHMGAVQFFSRRTGLRTLKLIRADYDAETLPAYNYTNGLISIEEDVVGDSNIATNQVIVDWFDPIKNQHRSTPPVENLGAIQQAQAVFSQRVNYPGISTHELAVQLAQRDLLAAQRVRRFKLIFDRRAYQIEPGDVFRISEPNHGISNIVLRAGSVDHKGITEGRITIRALQDVFTLPTTVAVASQVSTHNPPPLHPVAAIDQRLEEVSYRDLCRRLSSTELDALDSNSGYVASLGAKPNKLARNYSLFTHPSGDDYADRGVGEWTPYGVLSASIGRLDDTIVLSEIIDLHLVSEGSAAIIDDEVLRVDTIDAASKTVTVSRACIDSQPGPHAAVSRMWFYDDAVGIDVTEYTATEDVYAKLATISGGGRLELAAAPEMSAIMAARQARPYPPANVKINSQLYPVTVSAATDSLVFTWAHRDKVLQHDVLVPWTDASVGPEPGVTYTIEIYDENGVLCKTVTGISGTSYAWTSELADSGISLNSSVRVTITAVLGGEECLNPFDYTFDRTA